MKKLVFLLLAVSTITIAQAQNTLLWRISGNGLSQPSYLFGTMHLLCADDIVLSDSLQSAIGRAGHVYLELEMDNMMEMFGAMQNMAMKGDSTLADLLTPSEYKAVKDYFDTHQGMVPFAMLETFKPMLTASLLAEQQAGACDQLISMEQLIMKASKDQGKKIKGLETMSYQLSLFDKIPYRLQAQELYKAISRKGDGGAMDIKKLSEVYRAQQLEKLDALTHSDEMGMKQFTDLLLYNRNLDWLVKIRELMPSGTLVFAVGAGHLPGEKGLIQLLKKAGYKIEPVKNEMIRKAVKEI